MTKLLTLAPAAMLTFAAAGALADGPVVVSAEARAGAGGWRFDVTIRHDDTGWDDYADGWGIYLADGTELGYRVLHHPHVDEQPFTRSLSGVVIPESAQLVFIRPRANTGDFGEDYPLELN